MEQDETKTVPLREAAATLIAPVPMASSPSVGGSADASVRASVRALRSDATITALHGEEAARAATFGRVMAIMCASGLVLQLCFTERDSWRFWLMASTLLVMGGVGAWVWWRARRPDTYTHAVFRAFAVAGLVGGFIAQVYLGVFSPVGVVITLGISFFGLTEDRRFIRVMAPVVIGTYTALGLAVALEIIPDVGQARVQSGPLGTRVTMTLMTNIVFLLTYWNARRNRAATIDAMERSNEAVRNADRREAQLAEANQNLDVALRAGAGQEGRYSGLRAGDYVLERVVGRGAMGEIYAASHASTGRVAAVKLLHAAALAEEEIAARFFREAEIARRLRSPHVVEVYEVGKTQDGAPFIAMELLRGNDLAWHLRQRQLLPLSELTVLIEEVARGLEVAHAAGVVHRDLKPQNIFLAEGSPRGVWKIVDFGVSKLQASMGTLTHGDIVGTPGYMSPEQARGEKSDQRADIFSLGAVAYRAVTGTPAFSGGNPAQTLYDVVFRAPLRPRELVPLLPRDVELVLALALAKGAANRFSSAKEMAHALADAARGRLDAATRRRARAVLAKEPWGRSARAREGEPTVASGKRNRSSG